MITESKLVRDGIPALIARNGNTPIFSEIGGATYLNALFQKIDEECLELRNDRTIEEVADLLEVLMAISHALGHEWQEVNQARIKKLGERGGFKKGILLHAVE